MTIDLEAWLIDTGDVVIQKLHDKGADFLRPTEWGVYWMWWIDYSGRNSGSFGPLEDMDSTAIADLLVFSEHAGLQKMTAWLNCAADESMFCRSYREHFDEACGELRNAYCGDVC